MTKWLYTNEMVRAARDELDKVCADVGGPEMRASLKIIAMRGALSTVAPLIAAQARREALEDAADIVKKAWVGRGAFEACDFAEQAILDLKDKS